MEKRISLDKLALAAEQNVKESNYWLNKLSGDLIKSTFTYDYIKKDVNPCSMHVEKFQFPETLFSISMKLSKGVDIKLHMILVTGLVILLNKYTGSHDILIGSPILKQEIEGEFVNSVLVFRNHPRDNTDFKELLLQVRETIIKAHENQNYPVEILLEELNLPVVENEFPLFDTVILLENLHDKRYIQGINYSILFSFLKTGGSIEGIVEYNPGLYRQSTIKRIIRHYTHVLEQGLREVNLEISRIVLLSEQERKQVLFDFNDTKSNYPKDTPLHELFENQSAKTPDNIALLGMKPVPFAAGTSNTPAVKMHITYDRLNRESHHLALRLRSKGVRADTIVAVIAGPSPNMIIGLLAILKAGGAYLPIEPDYPAKRIKYMLTDSGAEILVSMVNMVLETSEINKEIEVIDLNNIEFNENYPAYPAQRARLTQRNLAYVIYTSGTTGKPKGVMVEHGNVTAYLHAFAGEFKIKPGDTVIQLSSYAFDVFVEETFPILVKGGKLVIPTYAEMMDIHLLSRLIVTHQVNIIDCTPLLLNEFNKCCASDSIDNPLESVHTFISGGDILKREYVDNLLKSGTVYNTYGPTESTVCAAYYNCTSANEHHPSKIASHIPIGRPISNYNVYVVDENHNPVPPGVIGELCVSGDGVTRGYLNRPELTDKKFIEKPFTPGPRIYKSGDLGRWLPGGNIEFAGRKDHQVKIRGYRIETAEIENRLMKNKAIKDSVVIAKEGKDGVKYLCAYIVSDKEFEVSQLRESLALELPDYMIPSFFVPIRQIPCTANGKIDQKALPEPKVNAGLEYVPPQNPVEERMQKIWQMALGLESIGINDNFFSIGGHSLRGIQVVNDIYKEFNVKIPLAEMFKTPTIKQMAAYIINMGKQTFTVNDDRLVLIKGNNHQYNHLFFIHDGIGEVEVYIEFCNHLHANLNYWGIRAQRLENYTPGNLSVETEACEYIKKMKGIQPHGPYYIAGWSLGGTIVFEIALQLEQAGEEIRFLALIDSPPPHKDLYKERINFTLEAELNYAQNFLAEKETNERLRNVFERDNIWPIIVDHLKKRPVDVEKIKKVTLGPGWDVLPGYDRFTIEELIYYSNMSRTLVNARARYIPAGKIKTQVHYFEALQSKQIIKDRWNEYCCTPTRDYAIAGDHFSIFRMPHLNEFTGVFDKVLQAVKDNEPERD